ncbi:MAG: zinc ribbon domain-containing protein [Candidatus Sulfotelmatobacter sp.]
MDHPCHKCGHSIEDGKPFCSQCGAPQIRVAVPETLVEASAQGDGSVQALDRNLAPSSPVIPVSSLPGSETRVLRPCALAAVVALGLTALGLNPFVAALGAGFLAVVFYRRLGPGNSIRSGSGAKLGAVSGILFFAMSTVLELLAVALLHKGAEIRGQMLDKVQQAAARYPGPEVQPFLDFVKTPDGFAIMMVASVIFGLLAFVVLGSCGGALGAALLGRRDRP